MRKLVGFSILLAVVVIVLGAYTRLTDAGLGCPDWPGCYGHLTVPQSETLINAANEAYPERPVETHKAWNEMIHRYFAGTLGLCILAIAIWSLVKRSPQVPLKLPLLLLVLVTFQALLGMWTVTLNLLPVVVMGHLLGGFSVLTCLFLLYLRLCRYRLGFVDMRIKRYAAFAVLGIVVLVGQIALGGWTSANYAALACTEFPLCEGDWLARVDIAGAYSVPEADNYEYGAHDYGERMTMHIAHRLGAVITFLYLGWLAISLYRHSASQHLRSAAVVLAITLLAQVGLGVSNVVFSLPLQVAVLHNAVAACLLLVLVLITYTLYRKV
ncbi:COX15/CtaA family protein [Alteromonas lipolytica]|uniref:Cytochrome B n=1 Tax=Alteromonas lipolytica TaxID=1856405 RepID=A0A1E8FAT4_9ALTE|nr:COX15/CtaA family protein [Alteromonas lipolytica]OFI33042.1 cytochrome B [Alteromonas lipolytica]GGF63076.1 cytochrome b561 [Alteromonas lipolytica]